MNLREDKHWSYGAQTMIVGARGQRPFFGYASVQTDKTSESMAEIAKEFGAILKDEPATQAELAKVKKQQVLELAGTWETIGAVSGSIQEIVRYGLPDDYFATYSERVKALDLPRVRAVSETVIDLDKMIWIVVSDLAKIRDGIAKLGYGDIRLMNADGELIEGQSTAAAGQ